MLDPVIVGRILQNYREERRLSQEVVSGLAGIGRTHLSAIERGARRPTLDTFFKLCKAMQVPPSVVIKSIEDAVSNR